MSGFLSDLAPREVTLPAGECAVLLSLNGTVVGHGSRSGNPILVTASGGLLLTGPIRVVLHFSRGSHRWLEIGWMQEGLRLLSQWQEKVTGQRPGELTALQMGSSPAGPGKSALELWDELSHGERNQEPALIGLIAGVCHLAQNPPTRDLLAAISETAPEPLLNLMRAVKKSPHDSWSLKEAASMAGYSAFHLSRTFRASIDYGFPEFVDRCRTEVAVEMLSSSDHSLEDVASACGFGSTQAFRSACREYLGLLPSEIRSLTQG